MNIIVTGSEGIIGRKLVDFLGKNNNVYRADIIDKEAPNYINLKKNSLDHILKNCSEIYLFHGLSRISTCNKNPELAVQQNVLSNIKLFEKVKSINPKTKIIIASSIYAENSFGGMYGITKSMLEDVSQYYSQYLGLEIILIRIGSVYGDMFDDNSLPIKLLKQKCPKIEINPKMRREYIYIDDVVNAINSISKKSNGIFRLRGKKSYGIYDLIKITNYTGSSEFISDNAKDAYIEIASESTANDIYIKESMPFEHRLHSIKNQTFFFDFDGTIVDSAEIKLKSFKDFFSKYNALSDNSIEYLNANEGKPRKIKINKLSELISQDLDFLLKDFDDFLFEKLKGVKLIKGVDDYLMKLKSLDIKIILISAAPLDEIKYILEKFSFTNIFNELNSSVSNKSKLVKEIVNKYNINTKYSYYFGDGLTDMKAAEDNAIRYINIGSPCKNHRYINEYNEL